MQYKYTADFETTSASQYEIDGKTRVWGVCVREIESEEVVLLSTELKDFMNWLARDNHHHKTKTVYFHNLKFDGDFIVKFLFERGFTHTTSRKMTAGQFSTLISNTGVWYQIKICFRDFGTRRQYAIIQDSLKKLPFSAERIARAFNLESLKGEIDYDKYRPEPYTMTKEEEEYIKNDTLIIAQALKEQMKQGLDKMTIGSDSVNYYRNMIDKKRFDLFFPKLDIMIDDDIRESYRGGWTYLKPEYRNVEVKNVLSFDVNSLYPDVMRHCLLPFGEPQYFEGKYEYDSRFPLYIQYINVVFTVKDNYLPTIQVKNNYMFAETEYLTHSGDDPLELCLTNVDLDLFLEHHEIHYIEYLEGFKFMGQYGMFNEFIDYWYHVKETTEGAIREIAKLLLNNLYGKFATNPRKKSTIPYYENGEVGYKQGEEEIGDGLYIPMGTFITAYAREKEIRTAQKLFPYFIYGDTDSIKLTGITLEEVAKIIEIDSNKLGAWDYEGFSERGKFLRAKTYILENDSRLAVYCAGLPRDARKTITFDNFTYGLKLDGKLLSRRVEGGTVLYNTTFEIKG